MCNVFKEGLAEFIRSCTNSDVKGNNCQHGKEEEVQVPMKRKRVRSVCVKPSIDVGCIRQEHDDDDDFLVAKAD
jgi:hypothetical protein